MPSMSIREISLDKVTFQVNRDFSEEGESKGISYRLKVDSQINREKTVLSISLGVESPRREENPDCPFFFDLTMVGVFEFSETVTDELRKQYAAINGPAILFPYVRETLADITRRAGFPPLLLPVMNFVRLAQTKAEKGQTSTAEKANPPKRPSKKATARKRPTSAESTE